MIKNSIKKKYGSYENTVLQNPDVAKKLGKVLNNKTLYDVVSRDMNDPDIDLTSKNILVQYLISMILHYGLLRMI